MSVKAIPLKLRAELTRLPWLLIMFAAGACQAPGTASLPPTRFMLKCSAPSGSGIPAAAKDGFEVTVNQATNRFSAPWWQKGEWPIASVQPNKVVLMDDHIDRGRDNNPEDYRISFDLKARAFEFYEAYAALYPVRNQFSAHCDLIPLPGDDGAR